MADYDQPAFQWVPAANQSAYDSSLPPDQWFEAVAWIPQPLDFTPAFGAGGGGGGTAGPRGYPIGN